MIIISEVVHNGEVHFQVNSCFIEMISILYPNERIIFRGENKHIAALKENLQNENFIEFIPFEKYYDEKKYNWGLRIIGECIQISKTLLKGRSLGNNIYVWTCLFPTGHFFLNLITFFQKNKKHVIILHGELEFLKVEHKRKTEKLFGFILKIGMYLSSGKTKYIVLGDNIKSNLNKIISSRILERTYSVLHPYNFIVEESFSNIIDNNKLVIGAIGTQMLSKNSNYIYKLSEHFKDDIIQGKIIFRTIGKLLPEIYLYDTDLIEKKYANAFVFQKQFEFEISKLNFVIFFYDNSSYQLCASGAIFEAIRMDVPVISIENDFFRWLFNTYGDMGFLCKDLKAVELVVSELKQGYYQEKVTHFRNNITQFKINNNLKNLALNLKNII